MKILILSLCGRINESEDVRYLDLFLASLKTNVVPYFETKVILFSTSIEEDIEKSKTLKRVVDFQLENVVEVKSLYSMNLPQQSIEFFLKIPWYERIGLHMNMLFDYSKSYNFFDAEWIFHTDTDIELLPNFKTYLDSLNNLRNINNGIVLTLAGDSYNLFIKNKQYEYLFETPDRVYPYNTGSLYEDFNLFKITKNNRPDLLNYDDKIILSPTQLKTRNDFVGFSKEGVYECEFNWVIYNYNLNGNNSRETETDIEIQKLWKEYTTPSLIVRLSSDKGYGVNFKLQEGTCRNLIKVQLPQDGVMSSHYASGWLRDTYVEHSYKKIVDFYPEFLYIIKKDYL